MEGTGMPLAVCMCTYCDGISVYVGFVICSNGSALPWLAVVMYRNNQRASFL